MIVGLYPYQRTWLADRARRRALLKSRRIGGSFVATLDHVCEAVGFDLLRQSYQPSTGIDQVYLSTGERAAKELIDESVRHLRALETVAGQRLIQGEPTLERIRLTNGRAILSLPSGNLAALVGWGGSLLVDECADITNMPEVARKGFPVAGRSAKYPSGGRISLVGTPGGPAGFFHSIFEGERRDAWSRHSVTLWDALEQGFPNRMSTAEREAYVAELRAEEPDPRAFAQNYGCSFADLSGALITAEEYDACTLDLADFPDPSKRTGAGFDYARKRDSSAAVEGYTVGDLLYVPRARTERRMATHAQRDWVRELAERNGKVACDETGPGLAFVEELQRTSRGVVGVTLTSQRRMQVLGEMARRFNTGTIRVARGLDGLRRAVLSITRTVTATGEPRIIIPRSREGHADSAVALALLADLLRPGGRGGLVSDATYRRVVGFSDSDRMSRDLGLGTGDFWGSGRW